jgi:uncharacterized protein YycO
MRQRKVRNLDEKLELVEACYLHATYEAADADPAKPAPRHDRWGQEAPHPCDQRGHWRELLGGEAGSSLYAELGCGKGRFIAEMAQRHPGDLFLGIEGHQGVLLRAGQKLQEQQKQNGGNTAAANGNYTNTGYTGTIDNASGSDLGKKVAKYGCQYIGNPYVFGGTSLTNGADCSGFIYRIYKDFGYNLPRTSYEQRSAGTGVAYDQAQPGDIICYDGHVGIYIGGGKIVHASNRKDGIKVSNATYRNILAVRRIV